MWYGSESRADGSVSVITCFVRGRPATGCWPPYARRGASVFIPTLTNARCAACSSTSPRVCRRPRRRASAISEAQARIEPSSFTLGSDGPGRLELQEFARLLQRALDQFDEGAAQAVLDRLLADFTLATTLRDVVLPYLQQLGERWELGEISIAQEHYASHVIRGRLSGLARGWDGPGPRAILACPPDELHDLPLLIFGIVLNRNGWRVDYFGASTPVDELVGAAVRSRPNLIVLAATTTAR